MSAGSDPLTALRPTVPAQIAHSTTPSTTVQKRPFAEESQHVGPNGLSRVHQSTSDVGNASDSTAPSEPRSRPIFKMKRTGHSGPFPFPFPGRPAVRPLTDTNHDRLSPSVPSLPSPGSHLSGPDLNASSPQEPTIRKSLHEVSFADSNSPSQSPAQTPTTPSIGGDYMVSRACQFAFVIKVFNLFHLT